MKIIVIHGDNIVESYSRLKELTSVAKKRGWEVKSLEAGTQSLPKEVVGRGLFGEEKLIVIEGVAKIPKKDLLWLSKNKARVGVSVIIYQQTPLSKSLIDSLKADKVEEYKLPKLTWVFLETLAPGNASSSISLCHKVLKAQPAELVFALMARHLRDLYWVKEEGTLPFPSWRVAKLKRQASKFSRELLKDLISDMAEADIMAKTSKENLVDSIDFIIATRLE